MHKDLIPNSGIQDSTAQSGRVYPLRLFFEVQTLMEKLNLTPADCLQLLAEVLGDLDRQIEEADGCNREPYPLAFLL